MRVFTSQIKHHSLFLSLSITFSYKHTAYILLDQQALGPDIHGMAYSKQTAQNGLDKHQIVVNRKTIDF